MKLHTLLGIDSRAATTFRERLRDLLTTFKDNRVRFSGLVKRYTPARETGEALPTETKELGATVRQELEWFRPFFIQAVNAGVLKEEANRLVSAIDINIFGKVFKLGPTALLNLEAKLKELKNALIHIPLLDDSKHWVEDNSVTGSFKAEPEEWVWRTEKQPYNHLKAPATEKHPAQVEVIPRDENVGKWFKRHVSGAISVSAKASLLKRLEEMIATVIEARERANDQAPNIQNQDIGRAILDGLTEGIV